MLIGECSLSHFSVCSAYLVFWDFSTIKPIDINTDINKYREDIKQDITTIRILIWKIFEAKRELTNEMIQHNNLKFINTPKGLQDALEQFEKSGNLAQLSTVISDLRSMCQ